MRSEWAYDLTLVYNPSDAQVVEELAWRLRDEQFGLRVFAKGDLLPGARWINEVEDAIEDSGAVAVFFGPSGLEPWQEQEAQLGLFHAVLNERPIVPVLLEGVSKKEIDGFLKLRTYVDLAEEGIDRLVQAVTGELPKWAREIELGPELRRRLAVYRAVRRDLIDFTGERRRHKHFFAREDILAELDASLQRESGWLVLTGQPGLGKSAIFTEWLRQRELAGLPTASHFIRRGYKNWSEPAVVRANLAAQIEQWFPQQRDPEADPAYRIEQLLDRISPVLENRGEKLVLLVDGLDEAMALDERDNPISRIFPLEVPAGVFVVVGSRPRYPKLNWFDRRSGPSSRLNLDARSESNESAVQAYWQGRRGELSPTIGDDLVRVAVERAGGNLLHAVKLFERWERPGAERSLETIPHGFAGMLDELWERLAELPKDTRRRVHVGLAMLCAARESRPLDVLESLLGWEPGDARDEFLPFVREMLLEEHWRDPPAYRPFHEGFRELAVKRLPALIRASHETLVKWAAWPLEGDAPRRGYALQHRVAHQLAAGQRLEAAASCRDVEYLTAKACERGMAEVEREVRMAAREQEPKARRTLQTLAQALGACSNWAREAPEALPTLLHDRLLSFASHVHGELVWPTQLSQNGLRLRHPLQKGSLARTLLGHKGPVRALAVLPDGRLVSASDDYLFYDSDTRDYIYTYPLRVWDLDSGQSRVLEGHQDSVRALAVFPDGRLVSASSDNTVRVWDLDSGQSRVLEGHQDRVRALALLPDGRIVSASDDKTLRVWDLDSGQSRVHEGYEGHDVDHGYDEPVHALALLPDGRLASTSNEWTLRVWDLDSGQSCVLEGHKGPVRALAVLPDGRLVSASDDYPWYDDNTVRVWDLDSGQSRVLEGHRASVRALAILPDGRLASASDDNTFRVWDLDSGQSRVLEGHQESVFALAVLPDGRLVSASSDNSPDSDDNAFRVWDLDSAHSRVLEGHQGPVRALAVLPDGRLVSASSDNSPDSDDNTLRVWDLDSGQSRVPEGHRRKFLALAVLPDGRLVSAGKEETLRVWDLDSGQSRVLGCHRRRSWVLALAVLPDGRIVSASNDCTLRIWDLDSGHSRVLEGHRGSVHALAVLPDGRIVSASNDETLRIWDLDSGQSRVFGEHKRWVRTLAGLPDGRLASIEDHNTLRVWDLDSGQSRVLEGYVSALAGLPDGRLVSASSRTLRVWTLDSGQVITTVYGEAAFNVVTVVDEHCIVAGDELGNVWFLEFPRAGAGRC